MNKFYDKILLTIAVLLLIVGFFFYLKNVGLAPDSSTPIELGMADNLYDAQQIPTVNPLEVSWPDPSAQAAGPEWVYDVFTPPEIYIDASGRFVPTGWKPAPPPTPFGVYLSKIVRKSYRIQLEGYIEEDRSDSSKSLLLFFDEESQKQVRLRPGGQSEDSEFKVLNFDIERLRDEDGNIDIDAKANLLDLRTGEEVQLTHGELRYEEGVTVQIRSEGDVNFMQELSQAPISFRTEDSEYTLLEINIEDSSILVEKLSDQFEENEIRILNASSLDSTQSFPSTVAPILDGENGNDLDFMF